jgi:acyl carrier protein
MNTEIKAAIIKILCVDGSEITPDSTLKNDLGADSLDMVEIVMECEKRLAIVISDEQMDEIKTVADLERICTDNLNGK